MTPFAAIERRVLALARKTVLMPVEEIRLAVRVAELPRVRRSLGRILQWAAHPDFHVRRVALGALRRIGPWDDVRVLPVLLRCLADEAGWVRYDAAWALEVRGLAEAEVLTALKRLAGRTRAPRTDEEDLALDIDDADLMARVQAAKSLRTLKRVATR